MDAIEGPFSFLPSGYFTDIISDFPNFDTTFGLKSSRISLLVKTTVV
jgi:hypothetical protein